VVPGETGLVFPAGNVERLRDALGAALADDAGLRRWGQNACRKVREFGYRQASEGLAAALESVGIHAGLRPPQPR